MEIVIRCLYLSNVCFFPFLYTKIHHVPDVSFSVLFENLNGTRRRQRRPLIIMYLTCMYKKGKGVKIIVRERFFDQDGFSHKSSWEPFFSV